MLKKTALSWSVLGLVAVLSTAPLWAAETSDTELVKKTQDPVADLISVPLQNNFNFGAGMNDATIYVLNVQAVIPYSPNKWEIWKG